MAQQPFQTAMVDRAIRTIKAVSKHSHLSHTTPTLTHTNQELHFLTDMGLVSSNQITTFLSQLPQESTPSVVIPVNASAPTPNLSNLSMNEKNDHQGFYQPPPPQSHTPNPAASPPPYAVPPQSDGLARANALYAYNPTDAGDLSLQPGDRVTVLEYMNAEWWKGRSERTGDIGIFPCSYVRVDDAKDMQPPQQQQPYMYGSQQTPQPPSGAQGPMGYGNMPMAVSQAPQQTGSSVNSDKMTAAVCSRAQKYTMKHGTLC